MRKFKIVPIYVGFALLLTLIALIVGSSAVRIFNALRISNEVDVALLESKTPRLLKDKLDEVHTKLQKKNIVLLDEL